MSNTLTKEQQMYAIKKIASIIVEAVTEAGPMGLSEGSLYAMLMGFGCTLPQFESLIGGMAEVGMIKRSGHRLTAP